MRGAEGLCHLDMSGRVHTVGDHDRRRLLHVCGQRVDEGAEATRRPGLRDLAIEDDDVGLDESQQRHGGVVDAETVDHTARPARRAAWTAAIVWWGR